VRSIGNRAEKMKNNGKNASPPKVSVVMAVYNNRRYVPEAVESILNQTFKDFEFIIIDDGSTDGSGEWLEHRAKTDVRIRLVRQENRGLTKSLNIGCSLVRGDFIARMDADDVSYPNRFSIQIEVLKSCSDVVALGSQIRYIDAGGVPLFIRRLPLEHEEIEQCHLAKWGGFINHSSVMMRRNALEAVGGYDEKFPKAQDYDLWFRLGRVGRLANLPEVLLDYRHHRAAASSAARIKQSHAVQIICDRELSNRGISEPTSLPRHYQIYPNNSMWLLGAAARDGFLSTTFVTGAKLMVWHFKGIGRCIFLSIRSIGLLLIRTIWR
jgi:glycosyltransferase involved in cell wall biosynthesis